MKLSKSLLIILSISIAALSLSSCEEESLTPNPAFNPDYDPNNPQKITSNSLVGTWEMITLEYAGTTTNQGQTIAFSAEATSMDYEITFNGNPNTYSTNGGYTVEITSFIDGDTLVSVTSIPNVVTSGAWILNVNTLTIIDATTGVPSSNEILRATNNTFSQEFTGFSGQSLGGATVNLTSGQSTFRRKF